MAWLQRLSERQQELLFGGLLLGCIAIVAIIGEAVLRLRPDAVVQGFNWREFTLAAVRYDTALRVDRFRPGVSHGHIAINNLGFRGPDIALPKPANTLRIIVMGDSLVFGAQSRLEQTLPHLIAKELEAKASGCRVDYISVSGLSYTLGHYAPLLAELPDGTEPDIYILLAGNTGPARRYHHENVTHTDHAVVWLRRESKVYRRVVMQIPREVNALFPSLESQQPRADVDAIALRQAQAFAHLDRKISRQAAVRILFTFRGSVRALEQPTGRAAEFPRAAGQMRAVDRQALSRSLLAALERGARNQRWAFSNKLDVIPLTRKNFFDPNHYTPAGNKAAAKLIAEETMLKAPATTFNCVRSNAR